MARSGLLGKQFIVNFYALLDELTHPGLVFGDFYK